MTRHARLLGAGKAVRPLFLVGSYFLLLHRPSTCHSLINYRISNYRISRRPYWLRRAEWNAVIHSSSLAVASTRQHVKWTANSSAPLQHSQGQPISRFHNNTVSYPATVISQQGSTRRGVGKVQSGPSTTKKDRHVTDDIQIKQS